MQIFGKLTNLSTLHGKVNTLKLFAGNKESKQLYIVILRFLMLFDGMREQDDVMKYGWLAQLLRMLIQTSQRIKHSS